MAFADRPTRAQLRTQVRFGLMDTGSSWWTDANVNAWLDDWLHTLQAELELEWGTAIYASTDGTATFTYSDIADDILRPDAVYWNNQRLTPRPPEEMFRLKEAWRSEGTNGPGILIPLDHQRFEVWPPPPSTGGHLYLEYPRVSVFSTDTSTLPVPAWTRYSATPFVQWRAYLADGPLNDRNKALTYKAQFMRSLARLKTMKAHFAPAAAPILRPGGTYAADILLARRRSPEGSVPPVIFHYHQEEVPTGTVNGTNTSFTLTYAPSPAASLELEVDGLTYFQGTHYTLSSNTVVYVTAFTPQTSQLHYARYRRA